MTCSLCRHEKQAHVDPGGCTRCFCSGFRLTLSPKPEPGTIIETRAGVPMYVIEPGGRAKKLES